MKMLEGENDIKYEFFYLEPPGPDDPELPEPATLYGSYGISIGQ